MKKIFCAIVAIIAAMSLLCGCALKGSNSNKKTAQDIVGEHLNLPLEDTAVLEEWDTKGWFGDGYRFVKFSCIDGFEENLKKKWVTLPLRKETELYKCLYEWKVIKNLETGEDLIPEIEKGYWYFKETGDMNWDCAFYDCEENILYFFEYDA